MASLKVMRYLREEEKLLKKTLDRFLDQINRLKVEELSLRSELRLRGENGSSNSQSILSTPSPLQSNTETPSYIAESQMLSECYTQEELDLQVRRSLKLLSEGGEEFENDDNWDEETDD